MKTYRLLLFLALLPCYFDGIFSKYEIIQEYFEILLGDEDQIYENINLRVKKFNKTT
jgi:hypothetical protein